MISVVEFHPKLNSWPSGDSRKVTLRGYQCTRHQYSLRHIGSSTITKQTGNTIKGKCAIEISKNCAPWDKAGVVVMLSRTTKGSDIMIVTENVNFAINSMWEAITKENQWTDHIEHLLQRLSINPGTAPEDMREINYTSTFPYRTCDIEIPSAKTGYVYMFFSVKDFNRTYVGQTKDIHKRLKQHNSGYGARGTAEKRYQPYALAGYICGMANIDRAGREHIEQDWKNYNNDLISHGDYSIMSRIKQGERVVAEYNSLKLPENQLLFVRTIEETVVRNSGEMDT